MQDPLHPDERGIRAIAVAVLVFVVVGGVIDLALDRPTTLASAHVLFELCMIGISAAAASFLAHGWHTAQRDLAASRAEVSRQRRERAVWEDRAAELLRGLGSEISRQFEAWSLTPTERRIALMLLQGHSHKGMARLTGTSERTVRQHSVSVYRKAGLAGRAELAGFFLGSVMLPDAEEQLPSRDSSMATSP